MTPVQFPAEDSEESDRILASLLSDEELEEVVSGALTSEMTAITEAELLGEMAEEVTDKDRIAELEADHRMVQLLASTGFEGERFDRVFPKLSGKLIGYAFPILTKWLHPDDNSIFTRIQRYRGRIHPDALAAAAGWSARDRREIVLDTAVSAMDFFLDYGLRRENWDFRHGATLKTYFIGACLCCFSTVCTNRWKKQTVEEAFIRTASMIESNDGEHDLDPIAAIPDSQTDVATLVATRDYAARTFKQIGDETVRTVLGMRMSGMTQVDAAAEVGMTPKAVERRLHTQRRKLRPPTVTGNSEDEGRA